MDENRRPRVTLQIPPPQSFHREDSYQSQPTQASPYVPHTAASSLPHHANPFLQAMYAQRAGDFVFKQFEGLNRFTKSGLSVGEKSVVWLYAKFRAWSQKWYSRKSQFDHRMALKRFSPFSQVDSLLLIYRCRFVFCLWCALIHGSRRLVGINNCVRIFLFTVTIFHHFEKIF